MKKILAVVLILGIVLIVPTALAVNRINTADSINLSDLSFDEMAALRDRITDEITSRAEWKEDTVPAGPYEIGVDIPAGYWTISCVEGRGASIEYGKAFNEARQKSQTMTTII